MGCRGVHFAITEQQAQSLIDAPDDDAVMEIIEAIEENEWETGLHAETDKAWDAIHRALTDGTLNPNGGKEPLKWAVLGGRHLHKGEEFIVSLINPSQVQAVADAMQEISDKDMRKRYHKLVPKNYAPEWGEDDCQYTCDWYSGLREFFGKAAEGRRHVIFTVDQ